MGDAATADNHQVLNNTALSVANFRCGSYFADNVWMKDTWDDTGQEPDPNTVGEDMWKSPYIWVRNTRDTGLIHQHQSENPILGQTNWVYVKMHNGFSATTSGNLEVYWADASLSLTWPGAWTLLASTPVNAFAAHSTTIVEVPWSNLPATGHYCLLARWNSVADPMATPEGPDIEANVRANNNLIWRNLNIVELMPGASSQATLNVMNPRPGQRRDQHSDRSPKIHGKASFLTAGLVVVEFDATLRRAWLAGGGRGSGFKIEGDEIVIGDGGATLENVLLPHGRAARMQLFFFRLPTTPGREYLVDVEERRSARFSAERRRSAVVGGVSYEIHTDRR